MIDQAVILVTGRSARLGELIKDRTRAMLPALGKPIFIRVMDRLHEAGIRQFVVVVGEQEGEVAAYLNGSWVPDAKVQIALQAAARGTADALACAAPYLDGAFLLAAPDHLTPAAHIQALIKRFETSSVDVTISAVPAAAEGSSGLPILRMDGSAVTGVSNDLPRGRHAQAAFMLYVCSRRVLNYVGRASSYAHHGDRELSGLIQSVLAGGGKVNAVTTEWHSCLETELDLLSINRRLLREGRDTHILSEIPTSVHITPPVRIDPRVSIGHGAKIGPNVYLESGTHVGRDAVIWDSVVLRNSVIDDGEILHGQIVTRRARLSEAPLSA